MSNLLNTLFTRLSASARDVLSGNSLFSLNVYNKAGNAPLERQILREGASYGRQLSALNDVVAYLITHTDADENSESVKKFGALKQEIERVKNRHYFEQRGNEVELMQSLVNLAERDPTQFSRLMRELDEFRQTRSLAEA